MRENLQTGKKKQPAGLGGLFERIGAVLRGLFGCNFFGKGADTNRQARFLF
ncbi:hypothetical protein [Neisseria animalis]|uniref:hypothetical protein n=1 Tax=Neisseria animalis TaxID=492 RepID=UPI0013BE99BE|nr:hypothetical protein [Neisseria animalis]